MKHNSSLNGSRCSSSQRPHVVQDPNVRYSVSKCHCPQRDEFCPSFLILYFKIHFNIILPHMPGSFTSSFFFRVSSQNPVCISVRPCRSHLPLPTHSVLIWWHFICRGIVKVLLIQCCAACSCSLCLILLLGPNIVFSSLLWLRQHPPVPSARFLLVNVLYFS
jgi:hypothetical protein